MKKEKQKNLFIVGFAVTLITLSIIMSLSLGKRYNPHPGFTHKEICEILNPVLDASNLPLNEDLYFTAELGNWEVKITDLEFIDQMIFKKYADTTKLFVFTTEGTEVPKEKRKIYVIYESEKKLAEEYIKNSKPLTFEKNGKRVYRFWPKE